MKTMHTINIGTFEVSFEPALISIPRDGSAWDWLCNDWVEVRQRIKIEQADGWATVTGFNGSPSETGPRFVRMLEPAALTEQDVITNLIKSASNSYTPQEDIIAAISVASYPWGKLISLDWTALGYAPGGTEFCMLPIDGCAISLSLLCLDWNTLEIRAKG